MHKISKFRIEYKLFLFFFLIKWNVFKLFMCVMYVGTQSTHCVCRWRSENNLLKTYLFPREHLRGGRRHVRQDVSFSFGMSSLTLQAGIYTF